MTSKEIKIMSDKKYYSNLKESEKDFLNDIWMEKYNDIICNINNKNAIDLMWFRSRFNMVI